MLIKIPTYLKTEYYVDLYTAEVYKCSPVNRTLRKLKYHTTRDHSKVNYIGLINDTTGHRDLLNVSAVVLSLYEYATQHTEYVYNDADIIHKDGNRLNSVIDNLIRGDAWAAIYYKYQNNFDTYIKNRCCIIDTDYTYKGAIDDGLFPVRPIPGRASTYHIDSVGNVYALAYGRVLNHRKSSYGYATVTLISHNDGKYKYDTMNVIRLLGMAFLAAGGKNVLTTYIGSNPDRMSTDITKLKLMSRSDVVKKYHKDHPEHVEKYLRIKKGEYPDHCVPVKVDGVKYRSITDAARFVKKDSKRKSTLAAVCSSIYHKLKNEKYPDKLLYKKYYIEKVEKENTHGK